MRFLTKITPERDMTQTQNEGATRARIRAAAAAVFDRKGLAGLTMRAIAREVGLSATALYRHYPNRDAILTEIWRVGFEELAAVMGQPIDSDDAGERILALLDRYTSWALKISEVYELKHRYDPAERDLLRRTDTGELGEVANAALGMLVREIDAGIASGQLAPGNVWTMALSIWGLGHGLISLQRSGQVGVPVDELNHVARECMTLLLAGVRAPAAPPALAAR
jgi:AcrR family transcriptional regulator